MYNKEKTNKSKKMNTTYERNSYMENGFTNMNELDQWADESLDVLDNFLETSNQISSKNASDGVFSNIKETKLLVEELKNILNSNNPKEGLEKGEGNANYSFKDFYI